MIKYYFILNDFCQKYFIDAANLMLRFIVARDFFNSGLLKVEDFEATVDMFYEDWALPLLSPTLSAYLATIGEILLPIMLVLGLLTRLGAIGLFIMALVIEIFVYPGTTQHYYWLAMLFVIIAVGGQKWSVDHYFLDKRE